MHYLVTGGAGFIGSNTVDELVRRVHQVTVFDGDDGSNSIWHRIAYKRILQLTKADFELAFSLTFAVNRYT